MKIKQIEKSIKIVEQLKAIDAEIIQIEKMAMLCANGKIKSSFSLCIEDLSEAEEKKKVLDEDGNLIKSDCDDSLKGALNKYMIYWGDVTGRCEIKLPPKNTHSLTNELTDTETLNVLGCILCEKKAKRTGLINELKNLGVLTN